MKRTLLSFFLFAGICLAGMCTARVHAQLALPATGNTEKIYQLTGMVLERESNMPIAYCKVSTQRKRRLALTNNEGFFSIPVVEGDTLIFQRMGYATEYLPVSKYLKDYNARPDETFLYVIQYLFIKDLVTDSIVIRPYNTPMELRTAILNMPTTTRLPVEAVNHHVSPELLAYFMGGLPEDADDRLVIAQQRYVDYYTQERGRAGGSTVADPIAIYNFIKYMSNRSKERKEDNRRNYSD